MRTVPWPAVARWLLRQLSGDAWRPLIIGEVSAVWADQLELARRGLIAVPSGEIPEAFRLMARESSVGLLVPGEEIEVEEAGLLLRQDRHHAVATDPSLREIRRSLLAHCRGNSPIHLVGPVGSGKRSLAAWAHAMLEDRPLSVLARGGARQPPPGRWARYDELGELSVEQVHHLKTLLQASEPQERPWHPAGSRVQRPAHPAFARIFGNSSAIARVLQDVLRIAPLGMPVLILGESGVGKESLARAVHDASGRKGPYRALDLSTINESLVESELFGHVRGAFTGADRERQGAFRQANGGTLFLDELGNLSPRVQAKLLRVLQEKTVQPVGGDSTISVDVRVVTATNADLESMVSRGLFREDLLRRLDAVTLRLPPLRERSEDILLLATHFYGELVRGPQENWCSPEAAEALERWPWPGNVRELGNVMARAVAEAGGGRVEVAHLGALAPEERRPVPLLTTASDDGWMRMEPFVRDRSLCHRLTAVTLRLPPVRERAPMSVRNAVLFLLEGQAIRLEAMRVLERYPWWGNWTELEAAISALRANITGVIDKEALERTLPNLLRAGQEPIRVLLHPTAPLPGSAGLGGFQQDFFEEALLVGRVSSLADATRLSAGDGGLAKRLEEVVRRGGRNTACLDLGHLPQLSRLHFLVTREPEGLRLTTIPGARLAVWGSSLDAPLQRIDPGNSLFLGRAGEIQVRGTEGAPPYVHLLVYAGAVAQDEYSERSMERMLQGRTTPGKTVDLSSIPIVPPSAPTLEEPRLTVWELEAEEISWLADIVARFDGTDFKAAIEAASQQTGPTLSRIVRYLSSSRPTQYTGRLFEHPSNGELRRQTAQKIAALPDPDAQLERLPTAIRRAVERSL